MSVWVWLATGFFLVFVIRVLSVLVYGPRLRCFCDPCPQCLSVSLVFLVHVLGVFRLFWASVLTFRLCVLCEVDWLKRFYGFDFFDLECCPSLGGCC